MLRKIQKLTANQKGMSIMEVLAAVIVITIGILGLAPMMVLSVNSSIHAEDVTNAVASAQQMIEKKIGAVGFPSIPYTHTDMFGNNKYTVTTTVNDNSIISSIPAHVYQIGIEVRWVDDAGVGRLLTFTTYTTKN